MLNTGYKNIRCKEIHLLAALLVGLLALAEAQSSSISTSVIRMRVGKLRRPELCRDNLPRKPEELPALVVTAKVREVYLAGGGGGGENSTREQSAPSGPNRALVNIGRVIKGNQQLLGTDIIVSGFNSTSATLCPNYVKQNDTFIWLLNHEADRRYSIQGNNILAMNLYNLDRVNALASDEPLKRRPPIEDILCEAHYCAYGRCQVINEQLGQVGCKCPEMCATNVSPVCGSDNVTYSNECQLILEGCRQRRPLFVTRETSCS